MSDGQKNIRQYTYGARDFFYIPFSFVSDFLEQAHESRKISIPTFFIQCINVLLAFSVALKLLPVILGFFKTTLDSINFTGGKGFFLTIIIYFVIQVLSQKIKLQSLFKYDLYASLAINIVLLSAVVGSYFLSHIKAFLSPYIIKK